LQTGLWNRNPEHKQCWMAVAEAKIFERWNRSRSLKFTFPFSSHSFLSKPFIETIQCFSVFNEQNRSDAEAQSRSPKFEFRIHSPWLKLLGMIVKYSKNNKIYLSVLWWKVSLLIVWTFYCFCLFLNTLHYVQDPFLNIQSAVFDELLCCLSEVLVWSVDVGEMSFSVNTVCYS